MFRAAFYEKEITPPLGCFIPGYFNLRRGSDVKDRLYARATVIQNDTDTIAIISMDSCTMEMRMRDAICARIEKYVGIKPDNVMVACTHSHTGIPKIGYSGNGTPEGDDAVDCQAGYFDVFTKLIADCVILAYYRLFDAEISYSIGEVNGISFCRNYIMKNSTPRTNPGRLNPDIERPYTDTDNELPILSVKDKDGNLRGAIICFACHADCVDGTAYSGDYIAELSKQLKKLYGEEFVTVFLLGTCGDINHFNVKTEKDAPDHYRKMGRKIAGEVQKMVAFAEPVVGDTVKSRFALIPIHRRPVSNDKIAEAKHIVETVKEDKNAKIAADNTSKEQYELAMAKSLLRFLETTPEIVQMPMQVMEIGDVKLFAFPNEVFSKFGKDVKKKAGAAKRFVASICNESRGYIPTEDLIYDTIYEARIGANCLEAKAGEIMANKLIEMA
ncbi:MAG: neutral/alkaline non-lysosomal ceramidase N-terminal domain-containing protein [Clostridia bacterium]|nr:neutral/alkaline non-lysosomal ceramidase N-terminal domain-containing protein [Clostridia bacterium]